MAPKIKQNRGPAWCQADIGLEHDIEHVQEVAGFKAEKWAVRAHSMRLLEQFPVRGPIERQLQPLQLSPAIIARGQGVCVI